MNKKLCPKFLLATVICVVASLWCASIWSNTYEGVIEGYTGDFEEVEVTIEKRGFLASTRPSSAGVFVFEDLEEGEYAIKVRAAGFKTTPARVVAVPVLEEVQEAYLLQQLETNPFAFHWEEDQSTSGSEYAASVNKPHEVVFLNESLVLSDSSASVRLKQDHNISLVDTEEMSWTQEHATRLLYTLEKIPTNHDLPESAWKLVEDELADDIEVVLNHDGSKSVTVAEAAFVNAFPRVVEVDGKRGIWHSNKLHHAMVRYVTNNGEDTRSVKKILREKYGLSLDPDYSALTEYTTAESSSAFQDFESLELVEMINIMEDVPRGFHVIPELKYVVRRIDGVPHPLYPDAPAVAWPDSGYIEFMDSAFEQNADDIHRLILHEKAHFLWAHLFDDQLKDDWIELGGWYEDPDSESGWSTDNTTEFVSSYAHSENPNEDMAESISDFVMNPDILKSRSMNKYEFVRDRIMQGNIYISKVREDLTFEVYNLYPDYVYPGKAKRVDITVDGLPEEEKTLTMEIELHALDVELEGASYILTRVYSSIGTYFDTYLEPIDEDGNRIDSGTVLRGEKTLSEYTKAGYWFPQQIKISDAAGNRRYQSAHQFGWKAYVDNPKEDFIAPEYVANSASIEVYEDVVTVWGIDHEIQVLEVAWEMEDESPMRDPWPCYADLDNTVENNRGVREYGHFKDGQCKVTLQMPHYMPTSTYTLRYLFAIDAGLNKGSYSFYDDGEEVPREVFLDTDNPDTEAPEVDVNEITIEATPTNPDEPNGETEVSITYHIRDDNSGFHDTGIWLRDPQGNEHFKWHHAPERGALFPSFDQTEWYETTIVWILPPGSAPGTWGLVQMKTKDRAQNFRNYDFTETIQVEAEVQNSNLVFTVSNLQPGPSVWDPRIEDCEDCDPSMFDDAKQVK